MRTPMTDLTDAVHLHKLDGSALEQLLQQAMACHRAWKYTEAEALYRAALELQPGHGDTHHNLGVLFAIQLTQPDRALPHFEAALNADGDNRQYWFSYIDALIRAGQSHMAAQVLPLAQARGLQRSVVQSLAERLTAGGATAPAKAIESARPIAERPIVARPIEMARSGAMAWPVEMPARGPASAAVDAGMTSGPNPGTVPAVGVAVADEQQALISLFRRGDHAAGEALARSLLARQPDNGFLWKALGTMLQPQGRKQEALAAKQRAAQLLPDDAEALCNLGRAHFELGQPREAAVALRAAIAVQPDHAEAHNNLGLALNADGDVAASHIHFQRAVELKPDFAEAWNNLSGIYTGQGLIDQALQALERAVAAKPDYRVAHDNLLFVLNYHPDRSAEQIYQAYQGYERVFGAPLAGRWREHGNDRNPRRRLKLGYVSPDFRHHACSFFMEPLLAHHDPAAFEIYAYAELRGEEDASTQQYKSYAQHWVATQGLDDAALAERIRADGIDILVDLAGHTRGNRLGMFAYKPAPVSLSWMGYGYTTGLAAIDYYLTDEASAPPGSESLFSEQPWRLPDTAFAAYRPGPGMGPVGDLPALARGHVTLGTLTRGVRVNPHTVRVWSQILHRIEGARLVIDSRSYQDRMVQAALVARFAEHGIAAERLQIGCHSPPWDTLRGIDIGLDCFPHNSGTTLYETLYMGIPFVTLAGRPSVGRIGSSILQGLGQPDWIAQSEAEYVDKVVALAADIPALARLRSGLRERMQASPLMDEAGFAGKVEQAYREMFARWSAAHSPAPVLAAKPGPVPGSTSFPTAGATLPAPAASAPEDMSIEDLQAELAYNQGNQLHSQGRWEEALMHFRRALAFRPHYAEAHSNMGLVLQERQRLAEAEACYRAALAAQPGYALAHHNLGNVLQHRGDLVQAVACYHRALALGLDSQHLFDNLLFLLNYHPDQSAEEIYQAYREYDRRFGLPHRSEWKPHANRPADKRRLKIGYVSPDFRQHACGRFLEPLLASHDRAAFQIHAYAELVAEDQATARYKSYVDHWVPTRGLSDAALAERIRADGIDILVDLAGHTLGNRLAVFARKPAPVSLSWLGFGYTTGLSAIDYYLADEVSLPAGCENLFAEQPWRLPDQGFVYRPVDGMGEVGPLPARRNGHITLGTLSRSIRINHHTVRVWAQILQRLPGARLVLDSRNFADGSAADDVRARFAEHGIAADRLQIGCHSPPWDLLRGIDIGLDCFPHNSGTTLYETLFMGIPFVTLEGRPSVGRIGSSMLQGLGRPEWIARSEAEYVDKVVALAQDLPRLALLRASLRPQLQLSPLMDEQGFTRQVEQAYTQMFARWSTAHSSSAAAVPPPRPASPAPAAALPTQQQADALVQLFRQRRFAEGEVLARDMTERFPDNGFGWKALGVMLQPQGRMADALAAKQRAAQLLPTDAEVHCNLGHLLQHMGRFAEAEQAVARAVALKPDYAEAYNNFGIIHQKQGRLDEALASFRQALALKPAQEDIYSNMLFTANYHPDQSAEEIYETYREYDRRFGMPHRGEWKAHANPRDGKRKLKIGYVSPDFRNHACSRFLEPLLAAHDKALVQVCAYAELVQEDEATARYKHYVDLWVPTRGLSDAALAERIRADGIDILVDLAGHTVGNRLGVFARKPAPVSLSWLGFGYTTGLAAIDYYLADEASLPPGCEKLFAEQPWRLPDTPFVYRPAEGMGEAGPLPALGRGHITLGSLTRRVRINHRTIRVWAQVLRELPGARLLLDSGSFVDASAQQALAAEFAEHGIAAERLQIGFHSPPWDTLRSIDIGLDCFPHNSGTTLYESLFMGVPFVTLEGRPSVGRIGSSILQGLGHSEWIARSEAEYVDKVVALASDIPALARLRAGLRQRMQASPLMDERGFASQVEQAYAQMFATWSVGNADPLLALVQRAEAAFDLAQGQLQVGQPEQAELNLRQAVTLVPEFADANSALGHLLQGQGRLGEAEVFFRQALELQPQVADAHYNLGTNLRAQARLADAEACFRAALALRPDFPQAEFNLDRVLQDQGHWLESEVYWREALKNRPEFISAYLNLSGVLRRQQRAQEALDCLHKALEIEPENVSLHAHVGSVLKDMSRFDEAEASCRRALELDPDSALGWNHLAEVLNATQRLVEAESGFRRAIALNAELGSAHGNLGIVLQNQGRLQEAEESMRRALELNASDPNAHGNLLFVLNYHPDKTGEQVFAEYQAYDRNFCVPHRAAWRPHANRPGAGRVLKIGYVSPDFRHHSCTSFLEPLLQRHDKRAVRVYAYAELLREDSATARYKDHVDHWVPTRGISDAALAERIRADGIDILVDLAGHTAGNRLGVFARKPAPVSLSWLGYGCTTGLSAIDYYLTDAISAPEGSERYFSEQPWRLPCGFVYRPASAPQMGEVGPLPAERNGHVTFGTLTRAVRVNHRTVRVWAELLRRVSDSRLVIDSRSYRDAETQEELASRFVKLGIERERLVIGCNSPPWDTLRGIDIGLDCFPHNSGTTLFETLYMGIPYVTLADRPSVGRLGGSILQSVGHPEWIATSEDEYVDKAVALAQDRVQLARLRQSLREQLQSSALMDESGFARQVETAYRAMFERWENSRP